MPDVAYLLLIDGIAPAFTTTEEVSDAYVQALGFDRAYPGLKVPDNLPCALDVRTGMLDRSSARFVLHDLDGTLPALFGANEDDAEDLIAKVDAGTTATGASLYDRHVGVEKIGSAGERRRHSCVPGWNVGLEHISAVQASLANGSPSPVSDVPIVWAGRRFALYRLVRDAAGNWTDLSTVEARRAARVYWGAMTGQGDQEGRVWMLEVMGPEAWLQRTIGTGFSAEPVEVEALVELDLNAKEHVLVGWLDRVSLFDETDIDDGGVVGPIYATQTVDDTTLAGATTYEEIAAGFHAFVQAIAAATSGDAGYAFDSINGNGIWYSTSAGADGLYIQWNRNAEFPTISERYVIRLQVLASEKVLKVLGYDPAVQNSLVDPVANPDKAGQFESSILNIDYPSHWLGVFYSADAYAMKAKIEGKTYAPPEQTNNNGGPRRWPPIYSGGASVFDLTQVAQFFRARSWDPLYLPSSKAVPLPSEPDDTSSPLTIPGVGEVNRQGLLVLRGPYRDETDPEADVTAIQIPVRVAWRESSDGSVATDGSYPKLAVYDWPDPRLYGFTDERPSLWAGWRNPPKQDSEPTTMRPLLVLEHGTRGDSVPYLFARLAATTGAAAEWYEDDGLTTPAYGLAGGYLDVGPNDLQLPAFGDQGHGAFTDAETSVYGFGIPAEMIAGAADLPAGIERAIEELAAQDLFYAKVALGKVASATDVLRSLLSPTGWAVSLAGGRYGLFDPFKFEPGGLAEITIEAIAGDSGEPSSAILQQSLRENAPIDRIELKARLDPIKGSHLASETIVAADAQRLYRSQSIAQSVDGSHLLHPKVSFLGSDWRPDFIDRWRTIARWWTRQHFKLSLSVPMRRHAEFWPGAPVSITNDWAVNPSEQSYGIANAPGYVISRVTKPADAIVDIEVLVDSSSVKLYAPAALAYEYRPNTDGQGYRIFVHDDYLNMRGNTGTLDVEGFVEPTWSDAGGNADIEIWQFNGVVWTKALTGVVDTVNAEPGNCYITLTGALTGTWYRDMYHLIVLRNAEEQTAPWVFKVYAPIGDEHGNYTGATKTSKFRD